VSTKLALTALLATAVLGAEAWVGEPPLGLDLYLPAPSSNPLTAEKVAIAAIDSEILHIDCDHLRLRKDFGQANDSSIREIHPLAVFSDETGESDTLSLCDWKEQQIAPGTASRARGPQHPGTLASASKPP
jgi:hypothetical protein